MTSKLDEQIAEKREKLETLYNETSFGGEGFSHGYIKGEIVALEYASTIIRALEAKLEKAKKALETPQQMVDADMMYCLSNYDYINRDTVQKIALATAKVIASRNEQTLKELDNE